jgi:hypothetical protein
MKLFTVDEARAQLAELRPVLAEIVVVRANLAELGFALAEEGAPTSSLGGLPELKGAQAHLDEMLTDVQESGVQLKGFAPLLLDFAGLLDGVPVLLCWLEGETDLEWYHRADLGFPGRRRLPVVSGPSERGKTDRDRGTGGSEG